MIDVLVIANASQMREVAEEAEKRKREEWEREEKRKQEETLRKHREFLPKLMEEIAFTSKKGKFHLPDYLWHSPDGNPNLPFPYNYSMNEFITMLKEVTPILESAGYSVLKHGWHYYSDSWYKRSGKYSITEECVTW